MSSLRDELTTYEQNLRHAHSQIQELTKRNQHYSLELEKAKVGIVTMQQHMKNMKVNMGHLKHKMDAAAKETERQVGRCVVFSTGHTSLETIGIGICAFVHFCICILHLYFAFCILCILHLCILHHDQY